MEGQTNESQPPAEAGETNDANGADGEQAGAGGNAKGKGKGGNARGKQKQHPGPFDVVVTRDIALGEGNRRSGEVIGRCSTPDTPLERVDFVPDFANRELETLKLNPGAVAVRPASDANGQR